MVCFFQASRMRFNWVFSTRERFRDRWKVRYVRIVRTDADICCFVAHARPLGSFQNTWKAARSLSACLYRISRILLGVPRSWVADSARAGWDQLRNWTIAASVALRIFPHTKNTHGTVERLSPPRSPGAVMPIVPKSTSLLKVVAEERTRSNVSSHD